MLILIIPFVISQGALTVMSLQIAGWSHEENYVVHMLFHTERIVLSRDSKRSLVPVQFRAQRQMKHSYSPEQSISIYGRNSQASSRCMGPRTLPLRLATGMINIHVQRNGERIV